MNLRKGVGDGGILLGIFLSIVNINKQAITNILYKETFSRWKLEGILSENHSISWKTRSLFAVVMRPAVRAVWGTQLLGRIYGLELCTLLFSLSFYSYICSSYSLKFYFWTCECVLNLLLVSLWLVRLVLFLFTDKFVWVSVKLVPSQTFKYGIVVTCRQWLLLKRSFRCMNPFSSRFVVKFKLILLMFIVLRTAEANAYPLAARSLIPTLKSLGLIGSYWISMSKETPLGGYFLFKAKAWLSPLTISSEPSRS